jgi:hypothetical protein
MACSTLPFQAREQLGVDTRRQSWRGLLLWL